MHASNRSDTDNEVRLQCNYKAYKRLSTTLLIIVLQGLVRDFAELENLQVY